jgi:hypothetical protein
VIDTATRDRLSLLKRALAQRPLRPAARHALADDGRRWPSRVADCQRKKVYANRLEALGNISSHPTKPLYPYACIVCGQWHLTGVPQS